MATPSTASKPAALTDKVRSTLNRAGFKVKDLTDEQRQRAADAPAKKPALVGQGLVNYIVEGSNRAPAASTSAATTTPSGPSKKETKYGAHIVERTTIARDRKGHKNPTGPLDHKRIDESITKIVDEPVTSEKLADLSDDVIAAVSKETGQSRSRVRESIIAWRTQLDRPAAAQTNGQAAA